MEEDGMEYRVLNVRLSNEVHRWLRHIAAERNMSLKALLEDILSFEAYVEWGQKEVHDEIIHQEWLNQKKDIKAEYFESINTHKQ